MKLLRFKTIREYRIFRDFSWPEELQQFGRYNAVYGWNGCGKTTLSSLFVHLQDRANLTPGDVEFEFNHDTVKSRSLNAVTIPPVRVFNRDFQQRNLLETGNDLSPIYILGQESSQKQKVLDTTKAEITALEQQLVSLVAEEKAAADNLRKYCEKKAKSIKEQLRDDSSHRYNSYDRARLQTDLDSLDEQVAREKQLDAQEKKRLSAEKDAKPLEPLAGLSTPVNANSVSTEGIRTLLQTEIVAQKLDELVQNHSLNRWVEEGLPLHADSGMCRFCGGVLSPERLDALKAHFNESLKELQNGLRRELEQTNHVARQLAGWAAHDETRLYEDLREEYLLAKSIFHNSRMSWQKAHEQVEVKLQQRLDSLFECVDLDKDLDAQISKQGDVLSKAVGSLVSVIERHNAKTTNFAQAVSNARDRVAWSLIADCFEEYMGLQSKAAEAKKAADQARTKMTGLSQTATRLEREILEHRQAADELNADLHSYLGRKDLEFAPEENGYSVRRHGHQAQHLSEGEKTAITFLYFLKTLQDQSFDIASGIVVIDDPVSSLDANALFSAFGYMKERTKGCSQLFILTHNFSFFRQVKNWFHALNNHAKKEGIPKDERPPARFYQLTTSLVESRQPVERTSTLSGLDPMLEEFESEYHYLFKTVLLAQRNGLSGLEQAFPLPNMTRRLLESFLAFRYPQLTGQNRLHSALTEVSFDEGKKIRVLRFLNTHSHTGAIDDGDGDPWSLGEVQEVLSDMLDIIRSEDANHFEGMVSKVTVNEAST